MSDTWSFSVFFFRDIDGVEADADSDRVLFCAAIPSRAAVLMAKAVAITFIAATEFMDASGPTVGAVPPGVRVAAASALAASTVTQFYLVTGSLELVIQLDVGQSLLMPNCHIERETTSPVVPGGFRHRAPSRRRPSDANGFARRYRRVRAPQTRPCYTCSACTGPNVGANSHVSI
eukprot:COSAG05_NODE_3090_length_2332_cov_2.664577_2_plen_176_part_00